MIGAQYVAAQDIFEPVGRENQSKSPSCQKVLMSKIPTLCFVVFVGHILSKSPTYDITTIRMTLKHLDTNCMNLPVLSTKISLGRGKEINDRQTKTKWNIYRKYRNSPRR